MHQLLYRAGQVDLLDTTAVFYVPERDFSRRSYNGWNDSVRIVWSKLAASHAGHTGRGFSEVDLADVPQLLFHRAP